MTGINQENLSIWEKISDFWDERIGQGNKFQKLMVFPVAKELLQLSKDDTLLEIGCSSGLFASEVSSSCKKVVATDACANFLKIGKERYGNISKRGANGMGGGSLGPFFYEETDPGTARMNHTHRGIRDDLELLG